VFQGYTSAPPSQGFRLRVLLRGLAVNPNDRWPSMNDLLSRLDENARRLAEIDEWLAERGASYSD